MTLGAGTAWAGRTAYVPERETNVVSQYDVGVSGLLTPLLPPAVPAGTGPLAIAISPDGKSAYVANNEAETISQYNVGAGGALSPKSPPTVKTGSLPASLAISPDGKSLYVASYFGGVTQYDVGASGSLSPKSPETVPDVGNPQGVAISPDGKSVYVSNYAPGNTIAQYDVGPGGALSPKSPPTVPAGNGPSAIAISPDGTSVYVSDSEGIEISQYDVGPGGALSPKSPPTVKSGHSSQGVAVSPNGQTVYVADEADSVIERYSVGAGGALTLESETPTAKEGPKGIGLTPDGRSLYAAVYYGNVVNQYDVGPDGALSPKSPPTVTASENPETVAVLPDQAPVAYFIAPRARPGVPLSFNGSASSDPDGSIARYDWGFGDGQTVINGGPTPSHTYKKPGTYRATLTVTDNEGCSTTLIFTGQTAYCNGQASASQTQTIQVAYPGVRVRCPKRAKPRGCRFQLQAVTKKPKAGKGKRNVKAKPESAIARAKLKAGKSAIVSLKPRKQFRSKLAAAKKILVKETVTIKGSSQTRYRKLKVVR